MLSIVCGFEAATRRQHELPGPRVNVELFLLATKVVIPFGPLSTTCSAVWIPERRTTVKWTTSGPVRSEIVTPGTGTYAWWTRASSASPAGVPVGGAARPAALGFTATDKARIP